MKKIIFFLGLLMCVLTSNAQQALWGFSQIVSPEVHPDNTVTFRFNSPDAKKVQVTGDFLAPVPMDTPYGKFDAPGVADLVKNAEGVWEFTTEALSPELYSYTFIVDGQKMPDPSNVFQIRDTASITNVFLVGGDYADYFKVNDVPHGTVSKVWYDSPTLGKDRRMTIYTPPGYEKGDRRYPVFYLLHGMGGDENAWSELGRATQILDNMIARGEAEPMIVVMTNGNVAMEGAPGETSLGFAPPTTQLPNTMDGTFEQHFPDVVKYVDTNYRTIADKQHRAIAGLSMGGFHSLHISKEYPDMFDYVGLFSAAILPHDGTTSPVYDNLDQKLAKQFSDAPKLYWIAIGDKDFLYDANKEYRKMLDDKGYKYTYRESPDGHIWKNWRIYLTEFVPMLFKK
ncbi:MAG: esterase [Muribaculaceae bacterium]|nr:esterase [Muribaculaceae bacterium]